MFVMGAALALASCRKPVVATVDQPFVLHVGQPARLAKSDLDLYFRRVVSDSRCPTGVQCVTAGDAVVTLEGRIMKGPVESFEVRLPGGEASQDSTLWKAYDGYRVRLMRLEPYPTAGVAKDTTAYVGTFVLEKR